MRSSVTGQLIECLKRREEQLTSGKVTDVCQLLFISEIIYIVEATRILTAAMGRREGLAETEVAEGGMFTG